MNRGGRAGNKRRYDDYRQNTRPPRPSWEDEFEREVRQIRQYAFMHYGNDQGIPVLSFNFIGERQLRDAHYALGFGRGSDLRDRVAPKPTNAAAAGDLSDRTTKRQKKGKEDNAKDTKEKEPKPPREDKATIIKQFDDDLDNYFNDTTGEESKEPKKEDKREVKAESVETSHENETVKDTIKESVEPDKS